MKKILAILLSFAMLFTSYAFVLPVSAAGNYVLATDGYSATFVPYNSADTGSSSSNNLTCDENGLITYAADYNTAFFSSGWKQVYGCNAITVNLTTTSKWAKVIVQYSKGGVYKQSTTEFTGTGNPQDVTVTVDPTLDIQSLKVQYGTTTVDGPRTIQLNSISITKPTYNDKTQAYINAAAGEEFTVTNSDGTTSVITKHLVDMSKVTAENPVGNTTWDKLTATFPDNTSDHDIDIVLDKVYENVVGVYAGITTSVDSHSSGITLHLNGEWYAITGAKNGDNPLLNGVPAGHAPYYGLDGIVDNQKVFGYMINEDNGFAASRGNAFPVLPTLDKISLTYSKVKGTAYVHYIVVLTENAYSAKVNGSSYATFEEAYQNANNGDTIELLSDVTLASPLEINKPVTVSGNYTVNGTLIANADITLSGAVNVSNIAIGTGKVIANTDYTGSSSLSLNGTLADGEVVLVATGTNTSLLTYDTNAYTGITDANGLSLTKALPYTTKTILNTPTTFTLTEWGGSPGEQSCWTEAGNGIYSVVFKFSADGINSTNRFRIWLQGANNGSYPEIKDTKYSYDNGHIIPAGTTEVEIVLPNPTIGLNKYRFQGYGTGGELVVEEITVKFLPSAPEVTYVAQVGNKQYTTVEAAITASLSTGQAIKLLGDLNFGDAPAVLPYTEGVTYGIDLNGYTIIAPSFEIGGNTNLYNTASTLSTITCPVNIAANIQVGLSGTIAINNASLGEGAYFVTNGYTGVTSVTLSEGLESAIVATGDTATTNTFVLSEASNALYELAVVSEVLMATAKQTVPNVAEVILPNESVEKFTDITEALTTAIANPGSTLKLLANLEWPADLEFTNQASIDLNGYDFTVPSLLIAAESTLMNSNAEQQSTVFGAVTVSSDLTISGNIAFNNGITLTDGVKLTANNYTGAAAITLATQLAPGASREVLAGTGSFESITSSQEYKVTATQTGVTFASPRTDPYVDIDNYRYLGKDGETPNAEYNKNTHTATFLTGYGHMGFNAYNASGISSVTFNYNEAETTAEGVNITVTYTNDVADTIIKDVKVQGGSFTVDVNPEGTIEQIQIQRAGWMDGWNAEAPTSVTLQLTEIHLNKVAFELVNIPAIDAPNSGSLDYDAATHIMSAAGGWRNKVWSNLEALSSITFGYSNVTATFYGYPYLDGNSASAATHTYGTGNSSRAITYTVPEGSTLNKYEFKNSAGGQLKLEYIAFTLKNSADIYIISGNKAMVFSSTEAAIEYLATLHTATVGINNDTSVTINVSEGQDITLVANKKSLIFGADGAGNPIGFVNVNGGKLTLTDGAGNVNVNLASGNVINATSTFTGTANILSADVPEANSPVVIVKGENLNASSFVSANPAYVAAQEGYDIVLRLPISGVKIPVLTSLLSPSGQNVTIDKTAGDGSVKLTYPENTTAHAQWWFGTGDSGSAKGIIGLKIYLDPNSVGNKMSLDVSYQDGHGWSAREYATAVNGVITFTTTFAHPDSRITQMRIWNDGHSSYEIDRIEVIFAEPNMVGAALELNTDLAILYYAEAAAFEYGTYINPVAYAYVNGEFTKAMHPVLDEDGTPKIVNQLINGVTVPCYEFKFEGITPSSMGNVQSVIIEGTDPAGNKVRSAPKEMSVQKYGEAFAGQTDSEDEATKKLALLTQAMLNYGAYTETAQTGVTSSVNTSLTAEQQAVANPFVGEPANYGCFARTAVEGATAENVKWTSASLTLNDSIAVNLFFNLNGIESTNGLYAEITYGLNGDKIATIEASDFIPDGNRYRIKFNDMSAADLSSKVSIVIKDANGNVVSKKLDYSILDYVKNMHAAADANTKNMLYSMVKYIAAVDNLLGQTSELNGMESIVNYFFRDGFVRVSSSNSSVLTLDNEEFQIRSIGFGNKSQDYPTAVNVGGTDGDVNRAYVAAHHSYTNTANSSYTELAAAGFNTVRFSLNYNMFVDANGNFYTDIYDGNHSLGWIKANVDSAKAAGIKLILNMHVPFGGYQSNGAGTLLWLSPELQAKQIALFELIAETFKDEPTIIGYSLVNEPMVAVKVEAWDGEYQAEYEAALDAYETYINNCITAIRKHDVNHVLICERLYAVQLCGNYYTPATASNGLQVVADRYVTNPTKYISIEDLRAVGYSQDGTNPTAVTDALLGSYVTINTSNKWVTVDEVNNPGNFVKFNDTNMMYEFHNYSPMEYTHNGASWTDNSNYEDYSYPYVSATKTIDKQYLESTFTNYLNYQSTYLNAPLFCGEFGVIYSRFLNGRNGVQWVKDMIDIMEANNINFSYWNYKGGNTSDASYYGFGMYQTNEAIQLESSQRNHELYNAFAEAFAAN